MNSIVELSSDEFDFVGGASDPETEAMEEGMAHGERIGQFVEDCVEYVGGFLAGVADAFTNGE